MNTKRIMLAAARFLAEAMRPFSKLGRVWAFARLQAALRRPIPPSVVLLGAAEVHGTGEVSLGESLYLYRDLYFETREAGSIAIGDGAVLSRGVHIVAHATMRIGPGTMIGEYTSIRDANHRYGHGLSVRESGHAARPITIGANVWIGRGSAILAGAQIGDNAVIGANAVVTGNVPAGAVVAGVPARPLSPRRAA